MVLYEMAYERKKAVQKVQNISTVVGEHILRCVIYGNSLRCLNHWIQEIASQLEYVGGIIVKQSGKLDSTAYKKYLFDYFAEEPADIRNELREFRLITARKHNYPDFKVDDELINRSVMVFNLIRDTVCPMLSDTNTEYFMEDYEEKVNNILGVE